MTLDIRCRVSVAGVMGISNGEPVVRAMSSSSFSKRGQEAEMLCLNIG